MEEQEQRPDDGLAEAIAMAQEARANDEPPSRVRMKLVTGGMDGDTADLVIDKVYSDEPDPNLPLSERHRESSRQAAREAGGGGSWMWYLIGLGIINLLSWLFDWPFWIY